LDYPGRGLDLDAIVPLDPSRAIGDRAVDQLATGGEFDAIAAPGAEPVD